MLARKIDAPYKPNAELSEDFIVLFNGTLIRVQETCHKENTRKIPPRVASPLLAFYYDFRHEEFLLLSFRRNSFAPSSSVYAHI